MRYELKSIPLWPVTKVAFFVNLVVGFVIGLLLAVFMMPIITTLATVAAYDAGELDYDAGPLSAMTMIIPFMAALWSAFFNTVLVIMIAFAYNLVVKIVGGVELNLEAVELPSFVSESSRVAPEPVSAPPPGESVPEPPATDRPVPPPPVISQPEPRPPDTPPSPPAQDNPETGETGDKSTNE